MFNNLAIIDRLLTYDKGLLMIRLKLIYANIEPIPKPNLHKLSKLAIKNILLSHISLDYWNLFINNHIQSQEFLSNLQFLTNRNGHNSQKLQYYIEDYIIYLIYKYCNYGIPKLLLNFIELFSI